MKYFIVKQDTDYKNAPKFINWFQNYDMRSLEAGQYQNLPLRQVIDISPNPNTYFIDVISSPFFLVSKQVKEVLSLFEPNMEYRQILCLDRKNSLNNQYFLPHLPFMDCIAKEAEFNLDHSILTRPVLSESRIPDKGMFLLSGVKNRYVVMRLDIVEAILRRDVYGIALEEVEIVQ